MTKAERGGREPAAARPKFFRAPAAFRAWLEEHHASAPELVVGYYKRDSGRPGMTWPESVDEALCFGWIDGVRRSIDSESYSIRFTPRKATSHWSLVNVRRMDALVKLGLVAPAGKAAYARRTQARTGKASYESAARELPQALSARLQEDAKARAGFDAQPPWVRHASLHWVLSAKKDETRERRFQTLLERSREGLRIPHLQQASPRGAH